MSDYTKTVDFAAKDALAPGNAGKKIKGTEINTEFANIATAVATKADLASPNLTGTPTANSLEIGFRKIPQVTSTGETLATTMVGKSVAATGNMTAPNSTFAAGDAILIYNNTASTITVIQGSGVTMRLAGTTTTGTRTVAARGFASVYWVGASECVVSGNVT